MRGVSGNVSPPREKGDAPVFTEAADEILVPVCLLAPQKVVKVRAGYGYAKLFGVFTEESKQAHGVRPAGNSGQHRRAGTEHIILFCKFNYLFHGLIIIVVRVYPVN